MLFLLLMARLIADGPGDINLETGTCTQPSRDDVFGIAIYLTSNKINDGANSSWSQGYATDAGSNVKEAKRLRADSPVAS